MQTLIFSGNAGPLGGPWGGSHWPDAGFAPESIACTHSRSTSNERAKVCQYGVAETPRATIQLPYLQKNTVKSTIQTDYMIQKLILVFICLF